MSHPEFLKQKFGKGGVEGGQRRCWGAGCLRKNPFLERRRRRRGGREKRGTAPHPRQRAGRPLQSRLSSHLTRIEPMFEKFGMTHVGRSLYNDELDYSKHHFGAGNRISGGYC